MGAEIQVDEKTMIIEQDRQAREKKWKKQKKVKRVVLLIGVVVLAGAGAYVLWGNNSTEEAAQTVTVEAASNQTVTYAKLTKVNGNEITYLAAEEMQDMQTSETQDMSGDARGTQGGSRTEETAEGTTTGEMLQMGELPEGMTAGEMPQMGELPEGMTAGEMPQMGELPEGMTSGEMPQGMPSGGKLQMNGGTQGLSSERFTYNNATYRITEQNATVMIPVGTPVITKLGTETTFSRLSTGDYVAIITEKIGDEEVIVAVYIVG